jgi:hypothetical protein
MFIIRFKKKKKKRKKKGPLLYANVGEAILDNPECSYIFNGDNNALSEDGKYEGIYAKDYEVFQIIFS